jgi:hypothetical protein
MANTFRGPVYVNRREPPPKTAVVFVALTSLLTTTLALQAQPIGKQSFPLQDERPAVRATINADTSHGTPKTLTADKQLPLQNLQHTAPDPTRKQILASTAVGTAKTLRADAQAPVGKGRSESAPERSRWAPADTTQDSPQTLRPDAQLPTGSARTESAPERSRWLPADTTQDTPQTARPDAQFPFRNAPFAAASKQRTTPDTSLGLTPPVVAPFVNAVGWTLDQRRIGLDTSFGFTPSDVAPLVNAQLFGAIDKPRISADTSSSSRFLPDAVAVTPTPTVTPALGGGGWQLPAGKKKRPKFDPEVVPIEPQSFHEPQEPRDVPLLELPAYRPVPARSNFRELLAKLDADRIAHAVAISMTTTKT